MSKHDKARRKTTESKPVVKKEAKDTKEKKKMSAGKWVALIALPILAIYFIGVAAFTQVFVPKTHIDGLDFSFKTPDALVQAMEDDTATRSIKLIEAESEEEILLHDAIDYVKTATPPAEGWIDSKTPWKWPLFLVTGNNKEGIISVEYSKEKLDEAINNLKAMQPENIRKPKDAYLGRNGNDYEVVPEDMGTELIKDKLVDVLTTAIDEETNEVNLVEADCYTKPQIYSDNPVLQETYAKYKSINFQRIDLDLYEASEVLETPDILELYEGSEISEEKVWAYVDSLVAKYDTYEEERPFTNHYGEEMMVGTRADTYGFLMDDEETFDLLMETLKSKESASISPIWVTAGHHRYDNGSDIGGTYIEVSIDNQELWAYLDGEQVYNTDVVTGMYNLFDTPRGVFQIVQMSRDVHLKGEEKLPNGKKEKWDSFVNFWMAINWAGVGLHNASWRSSFGGSIYQGGGSHGCINMDYDAAQFLYETYDIGTIVVVW